MLQIFEDFTSLPPLVDQFFLVIPLYLQAQTTICEVEPGVKGKCEPLFFHCWSVNHFLLENATYVYREEEFSIGDLFQKSKLLEFVNRLGNLEGVVPSDGADKRHLKLLLDVSLLMGSGSHEGR